MGITADKPEAVARFAKWKGIGFPLAIDEGGKVMRRAGAFRRRTWIEGAVPVPGFLLLDDAGNVRHRQLENAWFARQGPEEILAALGVVPRGEVDNAPAPR